MKTGEKLFIDYAGQGLSSINAQTGEVHEVQVFLAVLGASNYTYAEMTWNQSLPDWIALHVRTFRALGGVPEVLAPDNLKAAVHRAHRYEPEINRTYAELAHHYDVAIIPMVSPLSRPERPSRAIRPKPRSGYKWPIAGFLSGSKRDLFLPATSQ